MLALKTILAERSGACPDFDEVDAGVRAPLPKVMGRGTRGPQSAPSGVCALPISPGGLSRHAHYLVEKQVRQNRTVTVVRLLGLDEREEEVARMLAS